MCSTNGKEVSAPVKTWAREKVGDDTSKSNRGLNYIKSYRNERTLACAKSEMETQTGF